MELVDTNETSESVEGRISEVDDGGMNSSIEERKSGDKMAELNQIFIRIATFNVRGCRRNKMKLMKFCDFITSTLQRCRRLTW